MKKKNTTEQLTKKINYKKILFGVSAIIFVVLVWQILAVTVFASNKALPTPLKVLGRFFALFGTKLFYKSVFSTLGRSLLSFFVAMLLGAVMAYIASINKSARYFIDPIITILRSVPTLGVTFILLIFYKGGVAAGIIAGLITLPAVYANLLIGLTGDNSRLLDMAKTYRVNKQRTFIYIVLPSIAPFIFAAVIAGLTLNLKVVIAAEIIAIPRTSIGSSLHGAYTSGDFTLLFAYVLVTVILSFLLEAAIKLLAKVSMPKG